MELVFFKYHVPKLLAKIGLADSRSFAERLLKEGAVEIDGEKITETYWPTGKVWLVRKKTEENKPDGC